MSEKAQLDSFPAPSDSVAHLIQQVARSFATFKNENNAAGDPKTIFCDGSQSPRNTVI